MEVLTSLPSPTETRPSAVTFGNFDGVHVGHQALLADLRRGAERLAGPDGAWPCVVVTFDPHPLRVLRPERAPAAIDTLDSRLRALAACGVDRTVVLRFDAELAARPAEWFAGEVLFGRLGARRLVVGPDTRFGAGAQGDVALLRRFAAELGAEVEAHPGLVVAGSVVSSSRIRHAVAAGDVAGAAVLLGRPFCLRGTVVHGDGRGRQLGFATANLAAPDQVQPAQGVYACLAEVDGALHDAVANVGLRPTFGGTATQVEAHLLDFAGDLYDRRLDLHFVARLRDEQRFAGLEALVAQIGRDVTAARSALAAWRAEGEAPCTTSGS